MLEEEAPRQKVKRATSLSGAVCVVSYVTVRPVQVAQSGLDRSLGIFYLLSYQHAGRANLRPSLPLIGFEVRAA